jgi:hypothetical protein
MENIKSPRTLPINHRVQLTKEQGELEPTDKPYSSVVGALLFISVCTRPDISFAVANLTKFVSKPGKAHWAVAIDVLSYLSATKTKGIVLGRVGGLMGYADSDWANGADDRKSVPGGAVFMNGSLVACTPENSTWSARQQKRQKFMLFWKWCTR